MGGELVTVKVPDSDAEADRWSECVTHAVDHFIDYLDRVGDDDRQRIVNGIRSGLSRALTRLHERVEQL